MPCFNLDVLQYIDFVADSHIVLGVTWSVAANSWLPLGVSSSLIQKDIRMLD